MKYPQLEQWAKRGDPDIPPAVRKESIDALASMIGWDRRENSMRAIGRMCFTVLFLVICAGSGIMVFGDALGEFHLTTEWSQRFWSIFKYSLIGGGLKYLFGALDKETLSALLGRPTGENSGSQ